MAAADQAESFEEYRQSLLAIRAYRAFEKHHPTLFESMLARCNELIEQGHSRKQVDDVVRAVQAELIGQLLPQASDEAIIVYGRLVVDQLDEFQLGAIEPCFRLLVPQTEESSDALPVFSERTRKRELATLDITLTSYDPGRAVPSEASVWPELGPIIKKLSKTYGEDKLGALQERLAPGMDKAELYELSKALYSEVLELEEASASKALRWILAP